jgi:hypothetical protein
LSQVRKKAVESDGFSAMGEQKNPAFGGAFGLSSKKVWTVVSCGLIRIRIHCLKPILIQNSSYTVRVIFFCPIGFSLSDNAKERLGLFPLDVAVMKTIPADVFGQNMDILMDHYFYKYLKTNY